MTILGIESSCDECSVACVRDGKEILSNVIATQIEFHQPYSGVVPEIASRKHTEWIRSVYDRALEEAGITIADVEGVAVTNRPGLLGSLLVGLSFGKALAFARKMPFVGVDHVRAHLHAPHIENDVSYPYIGLLLSGGHTIISVVRDFDVIEVLGTTIDDACGEAFDKVAKAYGLGYPGGIIIDRLARNGDPRAFAFPDPSLHKGTHRYDISYSGLKTAVINQLDQFLKPGYEKSVENIAAAFQKTAIDVLLKRLFLAVEDTGVRRVVAGGGVAANSYLRKALSERKNLTVYFPSMELCTDNGAMIAAYGYELLKRGFRSPWTENAFARVPGFKRAYP